MTGFEAVAGEELARSVGVTAETVAEWEAMGLLDRDGEARFDADAVERARLLRFVTDRGIAATDVQRLAAEEGDVLGRWVAYLGGPHRGSRTVDQAAMEAGVDPGLARRIWRAAGLASQREVFDRDLPVFRTISVAMQAGLPEEALVQLVRVFSDALGRVADAEARLFHFYVHERLRRDGVTGNELTDATGAAGETLMALIEPTILYFHRLAWERAIREDMLLHLAEDLAQPGDPVGQLHVSVLFVDLAGFTPLTDAMGDNIAAEVLNRMSELVRDAAAECDGRVIKQVGDEFMVVFPTAERSVRCGLHLGRRVAAEDRFPGVRMAAHTGTALYREADYFGATINIAARVAAEAERGEFLVTDAVRQESTEAAGAVWESIGRRRLKGVSEPLELFSVRGGDTGDPGHVDPVCGMHIESAASELRISRNGTDVWFCSDGCLQRFLAAPDDYGAG